MTQMMNENIKLKKDIDKNYKTGNIQKAIELCQSALLKDPTDADLHIRLGDLYLDWHLDIYQARQYIDEAITQYQIASETLVDNPEIYYKIGYALYYKGELDRAMNYFNLSLDNDGDKSQCHFMLANCLKKKDRYTD